VRRWLPWISGAAVSGTVILVAGLLVTDPILDGLLLVGSFFVGTLLFVWLAPPPGRGR